MSQNTHVLFEWEIPRLGRTVAENPIAQRLQSYSFYFGSNNNVELTMVLRINDFGEPCWNSLLSLVVLNVQYPIRLEFSVWFRDDNGNEFGYQKIDNFLPDISNPETYFALKSFYDRNLYQSILKAGESNLAICIDVKELDPPQNQLVTERPIEQEKAHQADVEEQEKAYHPADLEEQEKAHQADFVKQGKVHQADFVKQEKAHHQVDFVKQEKAHYQADVEEQGKAYHQADVEEQEKAQQADFVKQEKAHQADFEKQINKDAVEDHQWFEKLRLTGNKVEDLFYFAEKHQNKKLMSECLRKMLLSLDKTNICERLILLYIHGDQEKWNSLLDYISSHLSTIELGTLMQASTEWTYLEEEHEQVANNIKSAILKKLPHFM